MPSAIRIAVATLALALLGACAVGAPRHEASRWTERASAVFPDLARDGAASLDAMARSVGRLVASAGRAPGALGRQVGVTTRAVTPVVAGATAEARELAEVRSGVERVGSRATRELSGSARAFADVARPSALAQEASERARRLRGRAHLLDLQGPWLRDIELRRRRPPGATARPRSLLERVLDRLDP